MTYATIHFIKGILFVGFLIISIFTFSTSNAHAYFTTGQRAMVLDTHTALFLIDYAFGVKNHEVQLPIKASYLSTSTDAVSYAIIDKNGNQVAGKTVGIVLSKTPITTHQMYATPKGKSGKFTLAVFFTPDTSETPNEFRLQVTNLPFSFDGTQQLQLNPSELQYYTTKLISI